MSSKSTLQLKQIEINDKVENVKCWEYTINNSSIGIVCM